MDLDDMNLIEEIELAELDLRFETLKTRDATLEGRLHSALAAGAEVEPLLVTRVDEAVVVLDGIKRFRCMKTLNWGMAPCVFVGADEPEGILELLRRARGQRMNRYEEAGFVLKLYQQHGMNHARIASALGRSKGWVSMRIKFLTGMSEEIHESLRSGKFPLHAWMYSVLPFMRVNGESTRSAEEFVGLMSKERASLREIELLARSWFEGGKKVQDEIRQGNAAWVLERLREPVDSGDAMSSIEQQLFKKLMKLESLIRDFRSGTFRSKKEYSMAFRSQACVVCTGLLANLHELKKPLEELYAECREA